MILSVKRELGRQLKQLSKLLLVFALVPLEIFFSDLVGLAR